MKRVLVLCIILLLGGIASSATAWAALTQTQVSQLYVGVFGRASEGGAIHIGGPTPAAPV